MNYILLTPKIKSELANKLNEYNNELNTNLSLKEFLSNTFDNNNKGIMYNKISDNPLKIKIWSPHLVLILQECEQYGGFKTINIKENSLEKYIQMLQYCNILDGEWVFELLSSEMRSDSDYEYIRDEESYNEKTEEFDKYHKYWLNYDLITQKREQKSKENQQASITEYQNLSINFDKKTINISLVSPQFHFKTGDRVQISIDKYEDKAKRRNIIGEVREYQNKVLTIYIGDNESINNIFNNKKQYNSGQVYIDDIGTAIMLKRQKNALKKLFNRETANPNLKDFIPNIKLLDEESEFIINNDIDENENFLSMNDLQKKAVKGSISNNDIYLIQGPPGTGKTTVICEIINQIVKDNKSILISSQNHLAVDNVLQRIGEKDNIRAIRVGDEEKIELGCEKYLLSNRVDFVQNELVERLANYDNENKKLYEEIENLEVLSKSFNASEDKFKSVENLLISRIQYNETLNNLRNDLTEKNNEKKHLDSKLNNINIIDDNAERKIQSMKSLFNQYGYDYVSNGDIGLILSELNITKNEEESIENYNNLVLILQNEIEDHKEKIEERNKTSNQIIKLEEEFDTNRNKIISLSEQLENSNSGVQRIIIDKINNLKTELRVLKDEYREKEFVLNGLDKQLKEHKQLILECKSNAEQYKFEIDEILLKNIEVCSTKKELLELYNLQRYLLGNGIEKDDFKLIKYINEYDSSKELRDSYQEVSNNIQKLEKDIVNNEKVVNKIDEKLNEYSANIDVKKILELETRTIYDVDSAFLNKMKKYCEDYKEKKRRVEVLESTKDIRTDFANDLKIYQNSFEDMYLGVSNVICSTCSGIASNANNYFAEKEFDYVIIDEAAKCLSTELLIPMIKGRKIILVGDHKQLSPIIERDILKQLETENKFDDDEMKLYMNNSLFGIMFDEAKNNIKATLDKQYRMNSDISLFISKQFYKGVLKDGNNIIDINHGVAGLSSGMYWIDSGESDKSVEKLNGSSYYNEIETDIIIESLLWLDNNLSVSKEVGIISPYRAQRDYLIKMLDNYEFKNIELEINTIDAFQGREKQIVIMNLVRNNFKGEFGHVSADSRVNVALSRAQELLFVIGNEEFVSKNPRRAKSLYNLMKYAKENNNMLSRKYFEDDIKEGI